MPEKSERVTRSFSCNKFGRPLPSSISCHFHSHAHQLVPRNMTTHHERFERMIVASRPYIYNFFFFAFEQSVRSGNAPDRGRSPRRILHWGAARMLSFSNSRRNKCSKCSSRSECSSSSSSSKYNSSSSSSSTHRCCRTSGTRSEGLFHTTTPCLTPATTVSGESASFFISGFGSSSQARKIHSKERKEKKKKKKKCSFRGINRRYSHLQLLLSTTLYSSYYPLLLYSRVLFL